MSQKQETIERVRELGLLAVIRGPSPDVTLKIVDALFAGGVYGQVAEAKEAGARFIVSPHLEPELAEMMVPSALAVMIGALTPSEIVQAYSYGSDVVKIFPGSLGGPAYMKALRGPFPDIPMMPTGGVSPDNLVDWFSAGALAVGAGSKLCPTAWAQEGRFEDIAARASEFVKAVEQARQAAG